MSDVIAPAARSDYAKLVQLAREAGLPTDDLTPNHLSSFLVCRSADQVIKGMCGLEMHHADALLRSLVVDPSSRGKGIGIALLDAAQNFARSENVQTLYLLTESVPDFFRSAGYEVCDRHAVPDAIAATSQFDSLCPDSAVCLRKSLIAS